jgi:hypothetical protein
MLDGLPEGIVTFPTSARTVRCDWSRRWDAPGCTSATEFSQYVGVDATTAASDPAQPPGRHRWRNNSANK